jgi:hypothetical protein
VSELTCEQIARASLDEPLKCEGAELLWRCLHPERHSNGDAHPSLKVNPQKNTWGCFVCGVSGTAWQLAAFLARLDPGDKPGVTAWLKERGLLDDKGIKRRPSKRAPSERGRCVAEYTYHDADRNPFVRKLRFEPGTDGRKKDFTLQRFENGSWVDGLTGVKPPLYRLPEIAPSTWVVLTEGEKDSDAGAKIGLPTTTTGGVGSFRDDHTDALRGKEVVIIADADDPGREHAQKVAAMLYGKAVTVKVCEIPGSKDLAEAIEKNIPANVLRALFDDAPEWKPATGADILDSILRFVRRFVSLSEAQARAVALWVAHTFVLSAFDCTPYLSVNSAEKGSGKTRLLEVLEVLVPTPWLTGRVTAAVLTRKIDDVKPSLLLDESDTAFGSEKEYAEALRGVLNTGYRRGGKASCCVGQGANTSYRDFDTFCAKAIAGIGKLPDTVADRSIPVRLKRARRGEIERFRRREIELEAGALRARVAAWCKANLEALRDARPDIPAELSDRQADCCEPLLATADLASADWPQAARRALVELCAEAQAGDQSTGVRLLTDIRQVFDNGGVDRIGSADLVDALVAIETSPWAEFSRGKPLTAPRLARMLARYEITPGTIRVEARTPKGYYRRDFEDAFTRYLPPANRHNGTTAINTGGTNDFDTAAYAPCGASENVRKLNENGVRGVVAADPTAGSESGGLELFAKDPFSPNGASDSKRESRESADGRSQKS